MRQIRAITRSNSDYNTTRLQVGDIVVPIKVISANSIEIMYTLDTEAFLPGHQGCLWFGPELRLATEEEVIAYKLLGPTDLP